MKNYSVFVIAIALISCGSPAPSDKGVENPDAASTTSAYSVVQTEAEEPEVISGEIGTAPTDSFELEAKAIASGTGFGYEIFSHGKKIIYQPAIPALQGNQYFTSAEKALRVASLVMMKIRNNEMPPAVSVKELDSLGVLK